MAKPMWSGESSRRITERVIVEANLILQTPAHFGSGDGDDLVDMPLLLDPADEAEGRMTPLLTGASIAGALRSYLRELEHGYGYKVPRGTHSASVLLFGGISGDDEGEQSPLIVDDALGHPTGIETRDGVRLRPDSRTAEEDKLFNLQLWQAGTTFPLRFELLIRERDAPNADAFKQALATALAGFGDGSITLGARKRRGYGRACVTGWRVKTYDLPQIGGDETESVGLLDWLEHGGDDLSGVRPEPDIKTALGITNLLEDKRKIFQLSATFWLDGSLLIRSGGAKDDKGPDMVHLHSVRTTSRLGDDGRSIPDPILSGTSLGGALRARALKITNTIGANNAHRVRELIDGLFGVEMRKGAEPRASRVRVEESIVEQPPDVPKLVQNRVSIDRFTGGARDTALFNEQPVFGGEDTTLKLNVSLVNPAFHEIGLLLLLLKDLWTADLPLGGESSVGRGRLKGIQADLRHRFDGQDLKWEIKAQGNNLALPQGETRTTLEMYVAALHTHFGGGMNQ